MLRVRTTALAVFFFVGFLSGNRLAQAIVLYQQNWDSFAPTPPNSIFLPDNWSSGLGADPGTNNTIGIDDGGVAGSPAVFFGANILVLSRALIGES